MPMIGRARVLRSWGGSMDMSMDGSPIIDRTPVDGLYLNARLVLRRLQGDTCVGLVLCASDRDATNRTRGDDAFRLDRFATGHLIDEKGQGAQPNLH